MDDLYEKARREVDDVFRALSRKKITLYDRHNGIIYILGPRENQEDDENLPKEER